MSRDIFDQERLPPALDAFLRETNPWWEGKPGPELPPYRRWAFRSAARGMEQRLASITIVRGPRQVGKTTLQRQLIDYLLSERGVRPERILRVQFDEIKSLRGITDPILAITRWFQNRILGMSFNEAAKKDAKAYLFLDEVQNLKDWAPQLKALVDNHTLGVLVTGSSALRIAAGHDSLAGRVAPVELGTLLLREVAGLRFGEELAPFLPENGLEPLLVPDFWRELQANGAGKSKLRNRAFEAFSARGGYPLAQARPEVPWPQMADQLNETVIKRAIQHDLRIGERGLKRDPQLLEEIFRLACRYAGQSPGQAVFVQQVKEALGANVGWQRILQYLRFLDGALLIKLVHPLEIRNKRRKGNNRICLCDHGLRASWLQESIPLHEAALQQSPHLRDLAGHIAESVVGYYLGGLPHLDLAHFPERGAEPEVDYVLTIGESRIPLEVKYRQHIDPQRDTLGLRAFLEKTVYHAPFAVLVTLRDGVEVPDPRIITISLPSLLLMR